MRNNIFAQLAGNGSDSILEIDLSEFIRKAVGNDEKVFTLKLSPSVSNTVAGSNSFNKILRPVIPAVFKNIGG